MHITGKTGDKDKLLQAFNKTPWKFSFKDLVDQWSEISIIKTRNW